ncbi:replication restart helicase PriA [Mobilisporobacter senegalensis]|uniref:replication restart helicase PriA n=1 Tax=Mobilisporobacter senegalensis TaxID=1329262 RepID=UPI000F468101|nr:primosomal protein N' [Mobilisporobacter senegalensis]
MVYADVIVDISHENLDKSYQYAVPDEFISKAVIGALVEIPFGRGNRTIKGYIVGLSATPKFDVSLIKPLLNVPSNGLVIESHLIHLAYWIKDTFGATMNDALKTVIPVKRTVKNVEKRMIHLILSQDMAKEKLEEFHKKHNVARARLLEELLKENGLDYETAVNKLNISRQTIKALEEQKIIEIVSETIYRNPIKRKEIENQKIVLNEEQQKIIDEVKQEYDLGIRNTYLIHGITGSGKTEVYMELIEHVISQGRQVIMLIPEIALTFQTVNRFYKRFGDRISIMNSRLSAGERYDQYLRAKNNEIDIIIGPRSALFAPFSNLGLIIIDEEHEGSYKSETPPKYHAREVAIQRAAMVGASVILGSATPSLEAYYKALEGEYKLYQLNIRAGQGILPRVHIVDLREELKKRNKSIFSEQLKSLIIDRLNKKQQIMLFINRRGYAGFVSCRSCGHVMKCPHCDVSLTSHNNGHLVCHYCGYHEPMTDNCPACGSRFIAAFGTGTQKVEELIKKEFPGARVLRMDMDTTSNKNSHEKILSSFANQEADILVGTQMIVKGHDFPNVTLVGIIAADLSLYASDYRAGERTFQLLTQAAGRAGRGSEPGEVVIQTYNPEHYSIVAAGRNDYKEFYKEEMTFRKLMEYPPASHILAILITSKEDEKAKNYAYFLLKVINDLKTSNDNDMYRINEENQLGIIGPTKAYLSKAKDIFRWIIYVKHIDYEELKDIKNNLEKIESPIEFKGVGVQFDFDPMNGY